uniref:Uncharacterized protein n=1 Tax=Steinernema glaseri TaxID=37863 RepID=A0A1I7ZGB3_9BILA
MQEASNEPKFSEITSVKPPNTVRVKLGRTIFFDLGLIRQTGAFSTCEERRSLNYGTLYLHQPNINA